MLLNFITEVILGERPSNKQVEGDDGLSGANSLPPSKDWLYHNLGVDLKLDVIDKVSSASFCGNVFDPTDLLVVSNPIEIIVGFGWTTRRYVRSSHKRHMELLRSKSLSLLYQYRGNPILSSLAQYGLRVTKGYRARAGVMNEYEREQFSVMVEDMKRNGLPIIPVPHNTRVLVFELYGITIEDQLLIEQYLDSLNNLQCINSPVLDKYVNCKWQRYFDKMSADVDLAHQLDCLLPSFVRV